MKVFVGPLAWRASFVDGGGLAWGAPVPGVSLLDFRPLAECGTPGDVLATPPSSGVWVAPDAIDLTALGDYTQIASDPDETLTTQQRRALRDLTGSTAPVTATRLSDVLYELLTEHADPAQVRTTGPLVPTHSRRLELACGPLLVQRDFDFAGPEWPLVQATIQRQYRALRLRALAGLILQRNPTTGAVEAVTDFHRRFLTVLLEKFRLPIDGASAERFIPDDLEREGPLPHRTSISDNFNGADNAALGIQLTWTETAGDFFDNNTNTGRGGVNGGTAQDTDARAQSDLSSTDHTAQVVSIDINVYLGSCTRFSASARTYMLGYRGMRASLNSSAIAKVVSGARTDLSTNTNFGSAGETVLLESNGTSHTWKVNGVTDIGPFTDSSVTTGTRGGVFVYATLANQTFDDFAAADLVPPGDPPFSTVRRLQSLRPRIFAPGRAR